MNRSALPLGHAVLATQPDDHDEPWGRQLVGDPARRRAAVLQAGVAFAAEAGEPLAHGPCADLEGGRRSGHGPAVLEHAAHHHDSTERCGAGILVGVHPGWPPAAGDGWAPTTCQASARVNKVLRSHSQVASFRPRSIGPSAVCAISRTADRSVPRPTGQRRSTAAVVDPRPYRQRHWTQRRHTASRSPAVARRGRTIHMAARRSDRGAWSRVPIIAPRVRPADPGSGLPMYRLHIRTAGGRHGGPAACRLALAERPRRLAAAMTAVRRRPATPTKVGFGSYLAVPLTSGGDLLSGVKLKKEDQKLTLGVRRSACHWQAATLRGDLNRPLVAEAVEELG